MAQTGYTPIALYYSTTASQVPVNTNLVNGELALNITDGKLYYKDNTGTVQLIAGKGGAGVAAGSNTQIQFNNSGAFGASSNLTWNGSTLAVTGAVTATADSAFTSTGALQLPSGTTGQQPTGVAGKIRFNTTKVAFEGYDGTSWSSIGGGAAAYTRTSFTATAGQTTFTVSYTPAYVEVFLNGVLLNASDYTASNGSTIVLASGAAAGDIVEVIAYNLLNLQATITYDLFSGTGAQTAYTMSVTPSNAASVLIAISGVEQDPSTYTVVGTTLTFSAAPPSGTNNISVRYLSVPTVSAVSSFSAGTTGLTPASNSTGAITLGGTLSAANGGTGQTNITFPSSGGTAMVSGNMPAFSAYPNTAQTINATTNTKIVFTTKNFDTANCFDNTTNYRFTPNVAGYYQINGSVMLAGTTGYCYVIIYKNGSEWMRGSQATAQTNSYPVSAVSSLVYCNGSTDYIELYAWFSATTAIGGSVNYTQFSGAMVRSA